MIQKNSDELISHDSSMIQKNSDELISHIAHERLEALEWWSD
jgi:hypothetical protein